MVQDPDPPPSLDFPIDSRLSKRPDQLAALLDSALRREYPEALDIVEIAQAPDPPMVSLRGLEKLEDKMDQVQKSQAATEVHIETIREQLSILVKRKP